MIGDATSPAAVSVTGNVAAQQVVKKTGGSAPWTLKSNHGLLNSDGTARITGLQARIDWTDGNGASATTGDLDLTWTVLNDVDFAYTGNAGSHGNSSILFNGGTISGIEDGTSANDEGQFDDFAGNDGSLADVAVIDEFSFDLWDPAIYTLTLWGTIASIDAMYDEDFSTTKVITVATADQTCATDISVIDPEATSTP